MAPKNRKLKSIFASFFAQRLTNEVKELYSSTLILDLAVAAIFIFEPVFLFLFFSRSHDFNTALKFVFIFYLAIYFFYLWLMPLGAKFAKRFGCERSIAVGTIFIVAFYLSLYTIEFSAYLIFLPVAFDVLCKVFYWPAYHGNFTRFSVEKERGREVSNLTVLISVVGILGPLLGGLILKFFDFNVLFIVVAILILVSNIPMLITKEKFAPANFSYFACYPRLFKKENRREFFAYLGFGEELVVLLIWPIFIYLVVGDFLNLGLISSASVFLTTVVFLYIGRLADKKDRRTVARFGAIFYFFSWLLRLLARTTLGVFLVDAYSRLSEQTVKIPLTAKLYSEAQASADPMKKIVFFEMTLVIGKIIAILLALLLLQIFSPGWNAIFILSGLMSLFYLFL